MSAPVSHPGPVGPDTLITVKVLIDNQNRRFKLALRDLGAHILPQKLRFLLQIPADADVRFDRFSDSAGTYVTLDSANPAIYKQLYRAAKAKLKLRLKATIIEAKKPEETPVVEEKTPIETNKRNTYLDTVLLNQPAEICVFKPLQSTSEPLPNDKALPDAAAKPFELSKPTLPTINDFGATTFTIDCNHCGQSVKSEHYHCGKCENGDFDLCSTCIERGVTCDGDDHWLIKRTLKDGKIIASNTETLAPKKKTLPNASETTLVVEEDQRTCNSCIIQLGASCFVTCKQCPDYDLCFFCLEHGEHGHHPAHNFTPVNAKAVIGSPYIVSLCEQGRGMKHEAICDGCNSTIFGVRHKCLTCPDFDYCSKCFQVSTEVHPGHRFAPIYEQLNTLGTKKEHHRGIYCDGPICAARARKFYIRGDRYKCAICFDTDFCANCEALPSNPHNKTHPLIKLKTPVRHLSIDTINELGSGRTEPLTSSAAPARDAATETTRSTSINAATQVQTMAEVKPVEPVKQETSEVRAATTAPLDLQAWFESDSTPDGSSFAPERLVSQSWTLRNPGPQAWPAGCAVHFIGGDDMRNLDDKRPSSISAMTLANRSNTLEHPVEPGKTAVFTVMLKSPAREGRAISYWRLKTASGYPFGHKLWVDITVVNTSSKPTEVPAPAITEIPLQNKETREDEEKAQDSSTMIFPKLDKESPESSISDIKPEAVPAEPSIASDDQDLLDDLDDMGLDDESTQDGFMTDEEYDILDAEDEEDGYGALQTPARK